MRELAKSKFTLLQCLLLTPPSPVQEKVFTLMLSSGKGETAKVQERRVMHQYWTERLTTIGAK